MNKIEMKNKARESIINQIIDRLEVGDIIWQKRWSTLKPYNETTKSDYKGINRFILSIQNMLFGYDDPRWMTYKQVIDSGYQIKSGSKSTKIEVYKLIDKETKKEVTSELLEKKKEELSKEEFKEYLENCIYQMNKNYNVFNGTQIEGLKKYEIPKMSKEELEKRNERIEKIILKSEAEVLYDGGNLSYYDFAKDKIHIPLKDRFNTMEDYYATTLYEIGHSTGHESRLNRKIKNDFGDYEYAFEELVAEITSVFTSQDLGLHISDKLLDNHTVYIKEWYNRIMDNPNSFFEAIKEAEKASNYILSYESKR